MHTLLVESLNGITTLKTVWQLLKLNTHLQSDVVFLLSGIYSGEMKAHVHTKSCR